jgi:hypothetical protein
LLGLLGVLVASGTARRFLEKREKAVGVESHDEKCGGQNDGWNLVGELEVFG